jgi:phosphoglycolate phosphatase
MRRFDAVLFDLDGTLVDSAPDLAGAANDIRALRGLPPLPYADLRPMVGAGARGMLATAFGIGPDDASYGVLRDEFLACYERRLLQETQVFLAMLPVLERLEAMSLAWGIVTNKALRFAEPLVAGVSLRSRAAVLIGGDSTPYSKPHPEPLLEAARRLRVEPVRCVYVGDDHRDVVAGRAAGMATLAAGWGYLGQGVAIESWGADAVINEPPELLQWLEVA